MVDEKLIWNIVYKLSTAFPSNADVMEASKNISLSVPDCEVYPGRDCVFAQNAAFCALNFCEYAEHFDDICLKNCLANLVDTVDYFIQDLMSISKIRLDIDDAILEADVFRSEVDEEFERYFNVVANTSAFHQMILHNLNGQSVVDRWSQPLSS
ncbi:MAG: hypothetical protein EOS41_19305 [Mesorhizobium sp.]|nr:MAG: hypothetical protein EOS41_19305 [Mesorhizobium sp.]